MRSEGREERNVIPRWLPLAGLETRDLESVGKFRAKTHVNKVHDFADQLKIWKDCGDLAAASDIFDAYILTRDRRILVDALEIMKEFERQIPPRLRDAVQMAFRKHDSPINLRRRIAMQETDDSYIVRSISIVKSRIREYPRDAISYLELARLYSVIGQFEASERNLRIARALAPNNRLILRATLQFYDTVSDLEEGLQIVRRSELLAYDPWIQSAEIASSTILGRQSKIASRRLIKFDKNGLVTRETTELAMAIATLERSSGIKERKFFKLVGEALPNATENGFSQAVWLSGHSSRDFQQRFPDALPTAEAYEAKVQIAFEQRQFEEAASFAESWLEEQPFNVDAILHYLHLSSVHNKPSKKSIKYANKYVRIFNKNWKILNAGLLVLVEGGELEAAGHTLISMDNEVPHDSNRAFYEAAKGMLSFAKGEFVDGRISYEKATKIAKKYKRFDLTVNATIFWLRAEAKNCLMSQSFIEYIIPIIERAIKKVDNIHKPYLESAWQSSLSILKESENEIDEYGEEFKKIAEKALEYTEFL